jgi:putative Mn2+ efflux pump MntP
MVRLLGLVLPLCLDTFAVAAALGMKGLTANQRIRFGALFAAFEGGMPLAGLLAGAALGRVLGGLADTVAIAAIAAVGAYVLLAGDEMEEKRVQGVLTATGAGVIALGVSVSLDELAIGFALGLSRVSVAAAVVLIAIQAFAVSQVGFAVGRRIGDSGREAAGRLAGIVLIALAAVLLLSKLALLPPL